MANPLVLPVATSFPLEQQKLNANQTYQTGLAENAYNKQLQGQTYGNQFRDLTQKFTDMRNNLPYGYNNRGLLSSGIFHQGLQDYARQRLNATSDLQRSNALAMSHFGILAQQLQQQRAQALAMVEQQRQAALAQLGAQNTQAIGA